MQKPKSQQSLWQISHSGVIATHITAIRASLVGQNGIEPGKWYKLSACGEFVECKGVDDQ